MEGRFANCIRQIRDLSCNDLQAMFTDDVAERDPQRFTSFEASYAQHHGMEVVQRLGLTANFINQHCRSNRMPFGDA